MPTTPFKEGQLVKVIHTDYQEKGPFVGDVLPVQAVYDLVFGEEAIDLLNSYGDTRFFHESEVELINS